MSLQWNASIAERAALLGAERGLRAGADLLLEEANRLVPLETGDLGRSGVAVAEGKEAAVGYSSVYAARQHEELGYQHDAGRQAKFLEAPLVTHGDRIQQVIADTMRGALG